MKIEKAIVLGLVMVGLSFIGAATWASESSSANTSESSSASTSSSTSSANSQAGSAALNSADTSAVSNTGLTNETQTSVAGEVEQEQEKAAVKKNDVDKLLTNNQLRAESGSKRKLSVSTAFEYLGGALSNPFSENRPNILQSAATTDKSDIDGDVAVQYNINETNSLSAGTGLRFIAPLQGGPSRGYQGNTFDAENPYVQYQKIANIHGIQSIAVAQLMQWTESDQTPYGYAQQYSVTETAMYPIHKLSVGVYLAASEDTFDKHGSDIAAYQSDYAFDLSPVVEYQFTPKINFRTVANSWIFDHYVTKPGNVYSELPWQESMGIGISVSRNVFLYPNVQFIPEHLAVNQTNVGVESFINLF